MADIEQRPRPERPLRRTRRFEQPGSTAALWPSQRRAARNRAALRKQHTAGVWLRRLSRP